MLVQVPPRGITTDIKSEIVSPALQFKPSAADLQFRAFSMLWAIASLFHLAHSSTFDSQLNLALLTLSALYVIFRPSMQAFILFIVLQLFDAAFRMPYTTNHWLFTAFVNLTILQTLLLLIVRNRSFLVNGDELFRNFAPVVRIEVIILYLFAVFHKLNGDFFNPAVSCATDLLKAQHLEVIFADPADVIFSLNAYLTITIETLIPVLLCFRRTVNAGVFLGLIFHSVISYSTYNAFYDFSSMVFAVYFLFLSASFSERLYESSARMFSRVSSFFTAFRFHKLAYTNVAIILALVGMYLLNKEMTTFQSVHLYFFWTLFSVAFVFFFLRFMFSSSSRKEQPLFEMPHRSLWIIPLFVMLNGASPYLGLKTENAYTMFSNLRTEGGVTNHFIVPAGLQVFDYQKQIVQIVSSTDPGLATLAARNKAMVLFEFRNYVAKRKPERIEYLLNGQKQIYRRDQKETHAALGTNPLILSKLMKFRTFSPQGAQACAH